MSTYWRDRYGVGTGTIPVDPVTNPEQFELEREKLFGRVWLKIGRVEDVPQRGDYFVKEIEVLRTSLLVVRGQDDVIRVFHNVCPHRGNRLAGGCVGKDSGRARGFACNFHGWTFDLEGKLVMVPDEGEFVGLDKSKRGLPPIHTDVWQGFIFINLDPEPKQTLLEYLAEMASDLEGYPFDSRDLVVEYRIELNANWRIWLDAFQEGYHVPYVHKNSVPEGFYGPDQPRDISSMYHLPSMRIYDLHRSCTVPGNPVFEGLPSEAAVLKHDYTCTHGQGIPAEQQPKGVNREGIAAWHADIDIIFPNFFIFASAGWYFTYNYWPLSVDRTRCEARIYRPKPKTALDLVTDEYARVVWRDAIREDFSRLEDVQSALKSGVLKELIVSDQEALVRHSHEAVERYVRS